MPVKPVVVLAVVAGLMVVGATALVGIGMRDRPGAGDLGSRMQIALFVPPEPTPVEGSTMDVGTMADGYEHHPVVQPAAVWEEPATGWLPDDEAPAYDPPLRRWRSDPGPAEEPIETAEAEPEGGPLSFGFDRRLPDFAAARRARRAAMEAQDDAEPGPETPGPAPERIDPRATRSPDMFY